MHIFIILVRLHFNSLIHRGNSVFFFLFSDIRHPSKTNSLSIFIIASKHFLNIREILPVIDTPRRRVIWRIGGSIVFVTKMFYRVSQGIYVTS